jgi:hypothetical protein
MDPSVWGARPHDLLALAAHNLGLKDEAIEHGLLAVEYDSNDSRLVNNLTFYKA